MAKRAIITGITGQDGSYLAELLLEQGYDVTGVVRRSSSPNLWRIEHLLDRVTLRPADLLERAVEHLARESRVEVGAEVGGREGGRRHGLAASEA